jgi:hypothetical protein
MDRHEIDERRETQEAPINGSPDRPAVWINGQSGYTGSPSQGLNACIVMVHRSLARKPDGRGPKR